MSKEHAPETPKGWRIDNARTLFENRIMQMVAAKVCCNRTGACGDFYKFLFPSWVNIVAVTTGGKLLLIRQYRYGTNRIELEIPGGAVNVGEDPLAAGERELLEETGYAGEKGRIIGKVCPNPAIQDNFCYTVLVENVRKISEPQQDDMEDIEVLTLPQKEVDNLIAGGAIEHGLVLNALMFFAMAMKTSVDDSPKK